MEFVLHLIFYISAPLPMIIAASERVFWSLASQELEYESEMNFLVNLLD